MPFSGNVYTPPAGSENAAPGQVIQSAVWDAIFIDLASALTTLMTQANTTPTFSNVLASNGGFAVWQRGAGSTASFAVGASSTQYTADRWYITTGANQACTVAATTGLTVAAPTAHAAKVTRNSGQTGVGALVFGFPLTLDEVSRLRGQQVSLSAAAKAGANWSPASGTFTINLYVGTGTAGKRGGGFTNETNPLSVSTNLAAGASNLSITGTSSTSVATTSTQGELQITWTPVGTAGADDSITFDQFSLVAGTIVQAFSDLPFDECLRQCKRFYRKSFPYGTAPAQNAGLPGSVYAVSQAAQQVSIFINFEPVEMYATAAFTTYNPQGTSSSWIDVTTNVSVTAVIDSIAPTGKGFAIITNANVSAVNHALLIHYQADAGL